MEFLLTLKQITETFDQFTKYWQQVQDDSSKFVEITAIYCGIINKVPMEHIPFYTDEYYMKVAAVYDAVDTLEFGKMRSSTQKLLHARFISLTTHGGFLASAYDGEKDIDLSYCSHEGLKFQLKSLKRVLERSDNPMNPEFVGAMDKIEDLENLIAVASRDINMYRLKIINLSRQSLHTALHKSQNRRFCLNIDNYYMDGNYGCLEGFKCEYYKKASGKEPRVSYKTLLYSTLEEAHTAKRDLYVEIRDLTVPPAPNYSHDELLASYYASLSDAVASSLELKEQLAAHSAEVKTQRAKSKAILQAQVDERNALTDPDDIRERDEEAAAHDAFMRKLVGGVRVAGDSSDDDDDLDSDSDDDNSVLSKRLIGRDEVETAPQHHMDLDQSVNIKSNSSRSKQAAKTKKLQKNSLSKKSDDANRSSSSGKISSRPVSKEAAGTHNKIIKRYSSFTSRERAQNDDNYSSTDSELDLSDKVASNHVSPVRTQQSNGLISKKKVRGSSFLNSPSLSLATQAVERETSLKPKSSSAPKPTSMLDQIQGSICDELKKKKRGLSHHMLDNSVVAEYDPSFPELDGHPHNDSLLHEIDERLVHLDDSDEDAEMENEDHHTVNVGWNNKRSDSPSSSTTSTHQKKKRKRSADPDKARKQQAIQDAAAAKKEEKRIEAKARRDEAVFHRRVLEANNGRNGSKSETDEDQNNSTRKRRVTSSISASWTGFYGVNLALNQAQLRNSALIVGCADNVLGKTSASSTSSSVDNTTIAHSEADYSVVLSYRKQSGAVCDRVLKQKLMKHLQLDLFKEITFERLITEYSVAKRESVGVADDEIIDIDWFEVMDGFSINLKHRLSVNSRIILGRIHIAIDDDNNVTAKFAMKERFTKSMNAFLRHGYRTINSIITKTVHKIGSHFDSLNFSDALPRHDTFANKTQGYAFSFTASLYNVFDENTAALTTGGDQFGVDPLLREIMKSSTNEDHMADVIEYTLIKKSRYTDSPASYAALHKYLEKRKATSAKSSLTVDSNASKDSEQSNTTTSSATANNTSTVREELWSTNTSTPSHNNHHSTKFSNTTPPTSNNFNKSMSSEESTSNFDLLSDPSTKSTTSHNNINKQLFDSGDGGDSSSSKLGVNHNNTNGFISKFLPIVIDNADQAAVEKPRAASLCAQVVAGMRQFLLLLLSDVTHSDDILCLKMNTKHNIRITRNLSLMKFLEENVNLDDVALYDLFCGSQYFKSLSCVIMIPFNLEDQYNIIGDGYCFYRALFMLLLRDQSGHSLSAEQLKELDLMLRLGGEDGERLRAQFQQFYTRIEGLFPDPTAKAKVAAASCTFTNLTTYLDERFWGGSDSVPFLDYSCTAFSYSREESRRLDGCWAKMYCSSIPGMINGRDTVNYNDVGSAYSLSDILMVLMRPHNWLLHKKVHFFVADHPTVETQLTSFATQMSSILSELRLRLTASKGEDSDVTFTEIYDRMVSGNSLASDVLWLDATKNVLERQLTEQNFMFGEEEEEVLAPVTETKHIETFLATPFGATQEQKIYISTINNTVAVKESENELLRTQLAGLKDMIARNSASVKCPTFIDCDQ